MTDNKDNKNPENQSEQESPAPNFDPRTMPLLDLIRQCGALRYSLTQIVALLRPRMPDDEINRVILAMRTSGSEEYNAYESGMAEADFRLQSSLLQQARFDKDMLDAFNEEQRRQAINVALADKFGLGE